jgi:LPS export ABC transporter protein LptC
LILAALAVLAAATWLFTRPAVDEAAMEPSVERAPLGYYVRGARLVGTDEQGRIAYRLHADRLDERPDEERFALAGVSVEYAPAEQTPWRISAASGSAPRDGSLLDLAGDVVLSSTPEDGGKPTRITTEQLRFSPETSSAESDDAVTIHFGDWQLQAKGLRTHLKDDTLELESDVHGKFAP